jgi:hypothetical protein
MVHGMIDGVVIGASCVALLQNPDVGGPTMNEQGRRTTRQPSEPADLDDAGRGKARAGPRLGR